MAYYNMYDMMYGYSGFGFIYMLVFWAAVIWLIVWAIKQFSNNNESSSEILEKRLARGDISKREYIEMKKIFRR